MTTKQTSLSAIIAPSLLSGDFAQLGMEARRMLDIGADWLHVDVMDGHFVNNLTIGPPVVQSLRKYLGPDAYLDCHLMVENPEIWCPEFHKAGASSVTVHIETLKDPTKSLQEIRKLGMKVGLSLKPKTDISTILPYLDLVDLVLVMTVEPGFGGQEFMPDQMLKVKILREKKPSLNIEVDGGISEKTIDVASKCGANVIVSGSGIFKAQDPKKAIENMRHSVIVNCLHNNDKK